MYLDAAENPGMLQDVFGCLINATQCIWLFEDVFWMMQECHGILHECYNMYLDVPGIVQEC
jgi:hypothetical protein